MAPADNDEDMFLGMVLKFQGIMDSKNKLIPHNYVFPGYSA